MEEKQKPYKYKYHYASGQDIRQQGKQTVKPAHELDFVQAETSRKEYIKLIVLYAFIFIIATIMSTFQGFNWQEWMRWFMGGFFIIFGSFKLIGYEMFVDMFPDYDIVAKRYRFYAYLFPFLQLGLGMAFILNGAALPVAIPALIISAVSAYGVFKAVAMEHHSVHCACLGNIIKLPLSTVSLYEDISMAIMSAIMIIAILLA